MLTDSTSPGLQLQPHEVHLWVCRSSQISEAALLSKYKSLLDEHELSRLKRFHFAKHRHSFLVSHALVRTVLSKYGVLKPHEWCFQIDDFGKPEITPEQNKLELRFNLSHTDGVAICAINKKTNIGADIETKKVRHKTVDIAYRYFSKKEASTLKALDLPEQENRFFDYWTLKESYIKAVGRGLSIPLDSFSFDLESPGKIGLEIHKTDGHKNKEWFFWQFEPDSEHTIAVCKEVVEANMESSLLVHEIVPLLTECTGAYTIKRSS